MSEINHSRHLLKTLDNVKREALKNARQYKYGEAYENKHKAHYKIVQICKNENFDPDVVVDWIAKLNQDRFSSKVSKYSLRQYELSILHTVSMLVAYYPDLSRMAIILADNEGKPKNYIDSIKNPNKRDALRVCYILVEMVCVMPFYYDADSKERKGIPYDSIFTALATINDAIDFQELNSLLISLYYKVVKEVMEPLKKEFEEQ